MVKPKKGPVVLSELSSALIDPVLARKAGINTSLLSAWPEIAGADFSDCTRPEKITWPRMRGDALDGGFEPGVLTIACEGARALFLSHAERELIDRINGFFGFPAIRRIRIVQKPVANGPPRRRPVRLTAAEEAHLDSLMDGVEEGPLRLALRRLGTAMARKPGRRG